VFGDEDGLIVAEFEDEVAAQELADGLVVDLQTHCDQYYELGSHRPAVVVDVHHFLHERTRIGRNVVRVLVPPVGERNALKVHLRWVFASNTRKTILLELFHN
jgi:hypothetical protein